MPPYLSPASRFRRSVSPTPFSKISYPPQKLWLDLGFLHYFLETVQNLCQEQSTSAVSDLKNGILSGTHVPAKWSDSKMVDAGYIPAPELSSSTPSTIARKFGNIWPK